MSDNLVFTSIVKAMLHFFGMTSGELIREWKELTPDDKTEFESMLRAEGYVFPPLNAA